MKFNVQNSYNYKYDFSILLAHNLDLSSTLFDSTQSKNNWNFSDENEEVAKQVSTWRYRLKWKVCVMVEGSKLVVGLHIPQTTRT